MLYYTYMVKKQSDHKRKELGDKLRNAREKAGLTQQEVADKTGMHTNYYARIERGEINTSYDKLSKLKQVLKVDIL